MYVPLYEKRGEIVSGIYEPTEEECEWESDEEEQGLSNELKTKVKIEDLTEKKDEYVSFVIYHVIYLFNHIIPKLFKQRRCIRISVPLKENLGSLFSITFIQ